MRLYVWVNATICVGFRCLFSMESTAFTSKGGLIAYLRSMFPLVGDYQTKGIVTDKGIFQSKERLHKISLTHARMLFRSRPHPVTRPGQGCIPQNQKYYNKKLFLFSLLFFGSVGDHAPVIAAKILAAFNVCPAVCSQQCRHSLPLLPADLQHQRSAGPQCILVMLCKGTVKHKAVLPRFQRHGRFLRHLRLQVPHFLGGEVGRVGYDQIKLPFRQALPVGEQVALHRLHRIGWLCLCAQSVQRRPPVKGRGICLLKRGRLQQVLRLPALPFQGAAAVLSR